MSSQYKDCRVTRRKFIYGLYSERALFVNLETYCYVKDGKEKLDL